MLTFWDVTLIAAVVVVLLSGGGALIWRGVRQHGDTVQSAMSSLGGLLADLGNGKGDDVEPRLAQIERRMEQLEQDALSYLRKGSQRYEQARRREARLSSLEGDGDDEDPGVSERDREQLELALSQGTGPTDEYNGMPSLESIRARMIRG